MTLQPFSQHLRLPHALGACDPQVASGDCPHTLFYGPPGAGKKTLILGLLRQIYGAGVERLKVTASHFLQGANIASNYGALNAAEGIVWHGAQGWHSTGTGGWPTAVTAVTDCQPRLKSAVSCGWVARISFYRCSCRPSLWI